MLLNFECLFTAETIDAFKWGLDTPHLGVSNLSHTHIVCNGVSSSLRHSPLDPACPPPFLKFLFSLPLCSVPPPFKVFQTVPPNLRQIPPALIRLTNLSWFKQISKGRIYHFSRHFLTKINFYSLLNPFTKRLSWFMGYFQVHF